MYVLNCGEEKAKIIQDILRLRLKNRNILHAWFKEWDVRATQPWNERIIKQSGSVSHIVCYWSSDETNSGYDRERRHTKVLGPKTQWDRSSKIATS